MLGSRRLRHFENIGDTQKRFLCFTICHNLLAVQQTIKSR